MLSWFGFVLDGSEHVIMILLFQMDLIMLYCFCGVLDGSEHVVMCLLCFRWI